MKKPRFNVFMYWGEGKRGEFRWKLRFRNVRQFALRDRLRRLYAESWDRCSILVEACP